MYSGFGRASKPGVYPFLRIQTRFRFLRFKFQLHNYKSDYKIYIQNKALIRYIFSVLKVIEMYCKMIEL